MQYKTFLLFLLTASNLIVASAETPSAAAQIIGINRYLACIEKCTPWYVRVAARVLPTDDPRTKNFQKTWLKNEERCAHACGPILALYGVYPFPKLETSTAQTSDSKTDTQAKS